MSIVRLSSAKTKEGNASWLPYADVRGDYLDAGEESFDDFNVLPHDVWKKHRAYAVEFLEKNNFYRGGSDS